MNFHINPVEPVSCVRCNGDVDPKATVRICDECQAEEINEHEEEFAAYQHSAREGWMEAYAEQHTAYYDGEGW